MLENVTDQRKRMPNGKFCPSNQWQYVYQSSYFQSSQSPDVTFTGTNDRGRYHVERVRYRSVFPRHQNQTLSPSDLRNYSLQVRVEIRPRDRAFVRIWLGDRSCVGIHPGDQDNKWLLFFSVREATLTFTKNVALLMDLILCQIYSQVLWWLMISHFRLNNKTAKVRQQAADLISRIAPVMMVRNLLIYYELITLLIDPFDLPIDTYSNTPIYRATQSTGP